MRAARHAVVAATGASKAPAIRTALETKVRDACMHGVWALPWGCSSRARVGHTQRARAVHASSCHASPCLLTTLHTDGDGGMLWFYNQMPLATSGLCFWCAPAQVAPEQLPGAAVRPHAGAKLTWLVDAAGAADLSSRTAASSLAV